MRKFKHTIFLFLFLPAVSSFAQESMMQDVSYPFLERLIDSAKARYPRMRSLQHKIEAAHYDVQKAKFGWFNALTLSYVYNPTVTNNSTNVNPQTQTVQSYEPGVFINVGQVLQNSPTIKGAKKNYAIAVDALDEYNLTIEQMVKERYFTYIEKLAILNMRTKSKDESETDLQQVKTKFEQGKETFDNYSKMLVIYTVSAQNKIEAEGQVLIAKSSLEEIIAGKLEDIK